MSIQELDISHNQKKKLLKAIKDDAILFQEENGDVVINVLAYISFTQGLDNPPIEAIIGNDKLDLAAQYIILK